MDKVTRAFSNTQNYFRKNADPAIVKKYSRFYREGYDPYGVDPHKYSKQIQLWYSSLSREFKLPDFKRLFVMLLESNKDEEVMTVVGFLRLMDKYYSKTLFGQIKGWMGKYFTNWSQVDSICAQVLSEFILRQKVTHNDLFSWHDHKSMWVRRSVPVTTIYVFYKDKNLAPVRKAADLLINDPMREIGQGVGWMLRDAWKVYPEEIEKILLKHVKTGNRTAYQYATEKMPKEYRIRFRRPK